LLPANHFFTIKSFLLYSASASATFVPMPVSNFNNCFESINSFSSAQFRTSDLWKKVQDQMLYFLSDTLSSSKIHHPKST